LYDNMDGETCGVATFSPVRKDNFTESPVRKDNFTAQVVVQL